jgi:hypothetical protein
MGIALLSYILLRRILTLLRSVILDVDIYGSEHGAWKCTDAWQHHYSCEGTDAWQHHHSCVALVFLVPIIQI